MKDEHLDEEMDILDGGYNDPLRPAKGIFTGILMGLGFWFF